MLVEPMTPTVPEAAKLSSTGHVTPGREPPAPRCSAGEMRPPAGRRRPDRLPGPAPRYCGMGVRTRGLDIKAGAAKLKADRAARFAAELVIDRWDRRLATGRDILWSPTTGPR